MMLRWQRRKVHGEGAVCFLFWFFWRDGGGLTGVGLMSVALVGC
jgi:hypothetical protein